MNAIRYEVIEQSVVNGILKEYVVDRFSVLQNAYNKVIELNDSSLSLFTDWTHTHYVRKVEWNNE